MNTIRDREIFQSGAWVAASDQEWRAFPGLRRFTLPVFGVCEYHGPIFRGDSEAPSDERRDCRCSACTLFEAGTEIPDRLRSVVEAMRNR